MPKDDSAEPEIGPDPARLLELRLDTIDHLMEAARQEDGFLGRRRRLLETARRMLLECSASMPLPDLAVQRRFQSIAEHITDANRAEAAGVLPDVALIHQVRSAQSRDEKVRLAHALRIMRQAASENRDEDLIVGVDGALQTLEALSPHLADRVNQSVSESLGDEITKAVGEGYARARMSGAPPTGDGHFDKAWADVVEEYLVEGSERDTLANSLAVDGCFEVGGVLAPVRITERHVRHVEVRYPTQVLKLVPATTIRDLSGSLIGDPRMMMLDLAAGRLLTPRYIEAREEERSRDVLQGEVRVYILDGSSSMLGPRARMRDAIMVAELATLIKRLNDPHRHTRIILYFRYFNRELDTMHKVDSRALALEAIRTVTGVPRTGGTDIEAAMLSSIKQVKEAQSEDPDLARAQIVMVTDGEDTVSRQRIQEAQAELGGLPVGISIIALGEQNEALRSLVAKQRQEDGQAFYHFLPDSYLRTMSASQMQKRMTILPPARIASDVPITTQFADAMQELDDIARSGATSALRSLDSHDRTQILERPEERCLEGEGHRARLEALQRDYDALSRRYDRWFPEPCEAGAKATLPNSGTLEAHDLESVIVVLATIADVVVSVSSDRYLRRADALDILERLLPNARLSPGRYSVVLKLYPHATAGALTVLKAAVDEGFDQQFVEPSR
tara:strand:+ start:40847 stop:42877 length:2031 start_codon:yes stop_codon:yes gene_type:complete